MLGDLLSSVRACRNGSRPAGRRNYDEGALAVLGRALGELTADRYATNSAALHTSERFSPGPPEPDIV
jgi:hypothetical protein